jgi:uncharacterized protein (DUF58 family)
MSGTPKREFDAAPATPSLPGRPPELNLHQPRASDSPFVPARPAPRPAFLTAARIAALPPLLSPEELDRFKNLLVFAKSTVEGFFAGKHKSPRRGSSAEFSDYKEYVAGDDVKRIDWRVYGRSERLFVRRYEEETDMAVYLLVDTSASMSYAGEKRQPKFYLAAKIASALAYLMIHQGDKAALALFADQVTQFLPPGGTHRHLHRLVNELERVRPASTTGLEASISECNAIFKKRGRLVILSDFLVDTTQLFEALSQFLHRKFEILLLHVLDPDELLLPTVTVAKFVDLETGEQVQVEPEDIRRDYRAKMKRMIDDLAREADLRQIQYNLVNTRDPYLEAIEAYLGFRGQRRLTVK